MNVIVTNVSDLKFKNDNGVMSLNRREYVDDAGNGYIGVMTNEAPLKSFMKRMHTYGECVDRIIYIESQLVRREIDDISGCDIKMNSAEYLRHLLKEYVADNNYDMPQYDARDSIFIDDEPSENSVYYAVIAVQDRLEELYNECHHKGKDDFNVYIESNGGVRYVLSMLLSVTRTLENRLEGFHIREITSMVLNQNPVRIFDTKSVYDTTQIPSIINEYVNYGRVNELKNYTHDLLKNSDDALRTDFEAVLSELTKLADDIQLCRTVYMLKDFYGENGINTVIDRFCSKWSEDRNNNSSMICCYILQRIKSEYKAIYENVDYTEEKIIVYLPKVIKWCLDKDFIQQGMTLCAERIPEYLFNTGKIELSPDFKLVLDNTDKGHYEECYYFVANLKQDFLLKLIDCKINAVLDFIKENNTFGLSNDDWNDMKKDAIVDYDGHVTLSDDIRKKLDQIIKLADSYNGLSNVTENKTIRIFNDNGFDSSILDERVSISNKCKASIKDMLCGKYIDKNGNRVEHTNLKDKKKRLMILLSYLVSYYVLMSIPDDTATFDEIIDELYPFNGDLCKALKSKYSKKQSEKYNISYVKDSNKILSNMNWEGLQKTLYIYSICKEQRNLSNHAYVSKDDETVAMNTEQLKVVMEALLNMCE